MIPKQLVYNKHGQFNSNSNNDLPITLPYINTHGCSPASTVVYTADAPAATPLNNETFAVGLKQYDMDHLCGVAFASQSPMASATASTSVRQKPVDLATLPVYLGVLKRL